MSHPSSVRGIEDGLAVSCHAAAPVSPSSYGNVANVPYKTTPIASAPSTNAAPSRTSMGGALAYATTGRFVHARSNRTPTNGCSYQRGFRAVRDALEQEKKRGELRIVEYSVQGNHLHVIAEVADRVTLTRRMQGFGVRFARSVNAMMGRTGGRVIAERYHLHVLRTPREVRNAIRYVLLNHAKHGMLTARDGIVVDPYSSGPWFAHWPEKVRRARWSVVTGPPPLSEPSSWLLKTGWRRSGAIL